MIDDFGDISAKLKMGMMGKRYRDGHAKAEPIGDTMINAVRAAIWDAWERGLDNGGENIYPRLPLLDREAVEPVEPDVPEL
jgi:hypothetical protein